MKDRAGVWITDIYSDGQGHLFADQVQEDEKPEVSKLLGPDGQPLRYAKMPMGFDLTGKKPTP